MSIGQQSDIELPADAPKTLLVSKHVAFIERYAAIPEEDYEYCATEHQRMSAVYWSLTALDLVYALRRSPTDNHDTYPDGTSRSSISRDEVLAFIASCFREDDGGFAPAPLHDSHILATLCAVQLLVLFDALDDAHGWDAARLDRVAHYIGALQLPDGSFGGDKWGEADTRYSLCALGTLVLIGRLDAKFANLNRARDYLFSCLNFDCGFGCRPGAESHAAYVYCALASLALLDALPLLDNAFERGLRTAVEAHNRALADSTPAAAVAGGTGPTGDPATAQRSTGPESGEAESEAERRPLRVEEYVYVSGVRGRLAWWLAERQLQSGGLNGRPEKLPDVCYSWWVLASLAMLGRLDWIDADAIADFILAAQDPGDAPSTSDTSAPTAISAATSTAENKTPSPDASAQSTVTATDSTANVSTNASSTGATSSAASSADAAKTESVSPSTTSDSATCADASAGGGISDRPGDMADPFHTVFGLAGLSLLAHTPRRHSADRGRASEERWATLAGALRDVDPVLCMPRDVLARRGIQIRLLTS